MKYLLVLLCLVTLTAEAQKREKTDAVVVGDVQCMKCPEKHIPFANIAINGTTIGTATDATGHYMIPHLPEGKHTIKASAVGYESQERSFEIKKDETVEVKFVLDQDLINLEQLVISGTRYELDRKESPVMVNVIDDHILEATQAVSLAEGLNFQPGLRMEANCQNCGFVQLRMNGLDGPYTQILMNSRPIFSSLQGVYGLEQIPANMIERIEVVRGGGSALYGGNAIAGTVNIITKDPVNNSYQVATQMSVTDSETQDYNVNANLTLVSDDLKTGLNLYSMVRERDFFDANGDGFSEITLMNNQTIGGKFYIKPNNYSKLSIDFHGIHDFRRGGNMFDLPAHLTDVAEQVDHKIYGGGVNYEFYNQNMDQKFSFYSTIQSIKRDSYYGAGGNLTDFDPDQYYTDDNGDFINIATYLQNNWGRMPSEQEINLFSENLLLGLLDQAANFYGNTNDLTSVSGFQYSKSFKNSNLTTGLEYRMNQVDDRMPGYNRVIDQTATNLGMYAQYEYSPINRMTLLGGLRYDYNKIKGQYDLFGESLTTDNSISALNPRINILYKPQPQIQLRGSYARGFRSPQAFDEDLHIETVGGGAQFIRMGEDLKPETSDAFTLSSEYKFRGSSQFSVLLEGFYTQLYDPFVNVGILEGDDTSPDVLEKQNANENAIVRGVNLEARFAPSAKFNMMLGGTMQKAEFNEAIEIYSAEDTDGGAITEKRILRTPDWYGYFIASYQIIQPLVINLSGNYTGSMPQPYESGLQRPLGIYDTPSFMEVNSKVSYNFAFNDELKVQIDAGVQNIFNSYQDDFDTGMDRDVGYIYGPLRPRTFFFGLKFSNF